MPSCCRYRCSDGDLAGKLHSKTMGKCHLKTMCWTVKVVTARYTPEGQWIREMLGTLRTQGATVEDIHPASPNIYYTTMIPRVLVRFGSVESCRTSVINSIPLSVSRRVVKSMELQVSEKAERLRGRRTALRSVTRGYSME